MSSCAYTRRPALSSCRFSRLSALLKDANARYTAVAASVRAASQPSHSARARACKLGLAVNVRAAAACPEEQVSVRPLPVLERSTPPPMPRKQQQQPTLQQQRGRPALRLVLPHARAQADVPTSTGPYSTISLAPTLQPSAAAALTVLPEQNIPWRGPTSRFSVTPSDPIFSVAPAPRRQPPSHAPFIPADVDLFSVPPRPAPRPEEVPVVPEMLFEFDADEEWELGYPPASGAADYASSSSSCASSSSGSSSSGSGPATPDDANALMSGLLAAFNSASAKKRKTSAVLDFDEACIVVDKCPKYQRKSWARAAGRQLC